tara:strand:- start:147 stop:1277 length:1131 start_codon:yes stop_codon:yes gene_type:complete
VGTDGANMNSNELSQRISDKALRYDLTVPFARYLAENRSLINLPFRRYEVGPVFRADRPQKGRLRQFTQCDADIIGSRSLWSEIELIHLIDTILTDLQLEDIIVKISNRKILEGIFQSFSSDLTFSKFCIIIDKLDKVGLDKVGELLLDSGFPTDGVIFIKDLFTLDKSFVQIKKYIFSKIKPNDNLNVGFQELEFIIDNVVSKKLSIELQIDFSLARGIDYYTGTILEAISVSNNIGSLLGGGRYDQLTEKFKIKDISGVGISFGLDRLCLALNDAILFPSNLDKGIEYLFLNFGPVEARLAFSYMLKIRQLNISCELYPDEVKINKQMNYADKRGAKFVIMIGEKEMNQNKITVKNMINGDQKVLSFNELIESL